LAGIRPKIPAVTGEFLVTGRVIAGNRLLRGTPVSGRSKNKLQNIRHPNL